MNEKLQATVAPLFKHARSVTLGPDSNKVTAPRYGGTPASLEGEPWPSCSHCQTPLGFIAQFADAGLLWRFFYCWSCDPIVSTDDEGATALLPLPLPSKLVPHAHIPPRSRLIPHGWQLKDVWTVPVGAEEEGLEEANEEGLAALRLAEEEDENGRSLLALWNVDTHQGTRIGGYANPIQDVIKPVCPACQQPMRFLARLGSHEEINWEWGDLGALYLYVCPTHPEHYHAEMQCY